MCYPHVDAMDMKTDANDDILHMFSALNIKVYILSFAAEFE